MPRTTSSSHLRGRNHGGGSATPRDARTRESRASDQAELLRSGFDLDRGEASGREGSEAAGRNTTAGRNHDIRKERGGGLTESGRPESVGKSHSSEKSSLASEGDYDESESRQQATTPAINEHLSEENDDYEPEDRHSRRNVASRTHEARRGIPSRGDETAGDHHN
jgi:hypothetical protein